MDSCTTLQLHITPLQLPSFTAHTIPSTIAPITQLSPITHLPWLSHHTCTSFTHTHTHISSTLPCTHCKVLFSPVWHFQAFSLSVFPWIAYTTLTVCCLPFDPACRLISSLSAACPDLCIAPVADSALPSLHLLLSLNLACLTSSCLSIKLHLDLTTLPLHYRRLRHLRSSGFISATQPNHGFDRPTPTSSPGRPVHWGVCSPVLWAVISGTVVRWISVQRLVSFRAQ